MTAADNWRVLAQWTPRPFDPEAFAVVGKKAQEAEKAIRNGLEEITLAGWPQRSRDLADHFGTAAPTSCFAVQPHEWASFLEPQITRGFAHFLMAGDRRERHARCLAFVRAALACHGNRDLPEDFAFTAVEVEAEEERIDLLVQLEGPAGTFGAVVEAKFGHRLTDQLRKAEDHVLKVRRWRKPQSAFLVLSREPIASGHVYMRDTWHSASWWTFLRHLDDRIAEASDCEDYRRFRRTVWRQAYQG